MTAEGVYFATDTPLEENHVYRLRSERDSCNAGRSEQFVHRRMPGRRDAQFFSTMVEPSAANPSRLVSLYGGRELGHGSRIASWTKDAWPMRFFQYGNAFLPDGENPTEYLAVTTIAVSSRRSCDLDLQNAARQVESERRAIFASTPKPAAHVPFVKRLRYLPARFQRLPAAGEKPA